VEGQAGRLTRRRRLWRSTNEQTFDNLFGVVASLPVSLPAGIVTSTSDLVPGRDRSIPVEPALIPLFPDAGLRPGHVVSCGGTAAWSLAFAVAARAVADGSWLAAVGVAGFGVESAAEHGLAPERVVAVAASGGREWAERVAAAADGFQLLLTVAPPGADRMVRKIRQRLQARGGVLLVVPPAGRVDAATWGDIELTTSEVAWLGIEHGHGRLLARRVTIRSAGRRVPRPVTIDCWLPGPDGCVDVVQTGAPGGARGDAPNSIDRAS